MGVPWGDIWNATKSGLKLAGWVWGPAKAISTAMDAAQKIKDAKGPEKLAHVMTVAEQAIDVSKMSPEDAAKARILARNVVENELQVREAVAATEASISALKAFVESVKKKD